MLELREQVLILVVGAPLLIAGMVTDARHRRIPNLITVSAAVLCMLLHTVVGGVDGLINSAAGMVIGLLVLMPFYVFRMVGAGDIKFLASLGAYLGMGLILQATLVGVLLAGLSSLVSILMQDRSVAGQRWALIMAKMSSVKMLNSDFASHNDLAQTHKSMPYGAYLGVAALGTGLYQIYALM